MKKFGSFCALLLISVLTYATTLVSPGLINPVGSSAGQAIVSTGSSTSPTWQSVVDSIIAGAGVTVSGATGNVTVSITTNGVTLGQLAQQPANTVLANATASTANVTAFTVPGCSTSSSALTWTSGTGFTCNTTVNASTLGGTAAASYALLASPTFTGTPAAPTATAGTNTTQIATTAFAQNAVTGGANAGAFTTLSASGNDALVYQNSSGQSIPNATTTTVTNWTKLFDRVNGSFNATTGVFTAPATGYYRVSASSQFAATAGSVGNQLGWVVTANSVVVAQSPYFVEAANSTARTVSVNTIVNLTAGQTMTLGLYQNTGAALALSTTAANNWVAISRVP
jgi:hypothetical protein|nr:MAG TPA: Baseplate wedge protein [Caudoviricetes sp.]